MKTDTFKIKNLPLISSKEELASLPQGKCLINTINAFSYVNAQRDPLFREALMNGDALIPDGASIVKASKWLNAIHQPKERVAGWDLFEYEMNCLEHVSSENEHHKVMFMGSSEKVLSSIRKRAAKDYPYLEIETYSPPFKPEFAKDEDEAIINAINSADPDLLWIGMTAPKQEKWAFKNWPKLDIHCHCGTIGAVFDFYAGTSKRAPEWWQKHSLEWLYRLLCEPGRMWRRYIIGNVRFLFLVFKEKFGLL